MASLNHTDNEVPLASEGGGGNLVRAFFGIIIFWGMIYLFVPTGVSSSVTLVTSYLASLPAVFYVLISMKKKGIITTNIILWSLILFSIKVFIGVLHYVLFMDGNYFNSSSPGFDYFNDYEWLLRNMSDISDHWRVSGFGTFPVDFVIQEQKNIVLLPYFAMLFYLAENEHFLNITVVNSFHNFLVAAIVSGFATTVASQRVAKSVFMICMLQPFGLFSSILWRDSVGQFFLVSGIIMIACSSGKIVELGKLFLAIIFMGLLRNVYILVGLISLFGRQLQNFSNPRSLRPIQAILFFLVGLAAFYYVLPFVVAYYSWEGEGGFVFSYTLGLTLLLKKIVIGLVGPFPWTQVFLITTNGREYLPQDILQSVFNLTTLVLFFWSTINKRVNFRGQSEITIVIAVFAVMVLGLLSYGHTPYVTVASVLLLPLIPRLSLGKFLSVFLLIFTCNISLGVFWTIIF